MKIYHLKKQIFLVAAVIIFAANIFAQNIKLSTEEDLAEDMKIVPCKYEERLDAAKKLFVKMGAKETDVSTETFKNLKNLVVKVKGKSDETIVIGAHYDKVKEGCGAIDNWTGIIIIANLYKSLSQFSTDKSYIFVAFDQEEAGLLGSKAMVKAIPKDSYPQYCSMVNFDSFGFAAPQSPSNMSNSKMTKLAKDTAKELGVDFADAAIQDADADSSSFNAKKIPAITFDGLSSNWQKYLHSANDKIENVNMKSVYLGYRFALSYLAKIDSLDCKAFK